MHHSTNQFFLFYLLFAAFSAGQNFASIDARLVGTWTSKSGRVLTGPNFYNPWNESFLEPDVTGISYSFTTDGYYEEARYRSTANPTSPSCLSAVIQWQHGKFVQSANGSLHLLPFASDGRQQLSKPCYGDFSTFTRYNQSEKFLEYVRILDAYNGLERLNLFQWDGTPENPMWLAYSSPDMLPTTVIHPTPSERIGRGDLHAPASTTVSLAKRSLFVPAPDPQFGFFNPEGKNMWFVLMMWLGFATTGIGSVLLYCF